jgi:competence protein ComFC
MISKFFQIILDLFFPRRCLSCGKEGGYVCHNCLKNISFLKKQQCPTCRRRNNFGTFCNEKCAKGNYFDQLIVCSRYTKHNLLKKLVVVFKYKFSRELVVILGEMLKTQFVYFSQYISFFKKIVIVPVPIHKKRLKKRGFNQAKLLADYLYEALKKDFSFSHYFENLKNYDCLAKAFCGENQAHLDKDHRLSNLRGAFSLKAEFSHLLKGKFVLLVDDIATTGSTLSECSKVLKDFGARYVCGIVLGRGR